MPLPFSDFPAHRACSTRVGGVDVDHAQTSGFGLVFDEALQLPEGPAMQSCPDTLPSLDTGADVGQVFHADFAGSGTDGFCDDGFAGFVVDVLDMLLLAPGDSPQFALCSAATVGLETTTMGKVDVAVMPQLVRWATWNDSCGPCCCSWCLVLLHTSSLAFRPIWWLWLCLR